MKLSRLADGFVLESQGKTLLTHSEKEPLVYVGYGEADIKMYRGNFNIQDYNISRIPLKKADISIIEQGFLVDFEQKVTLKIKTKNDVTTLSFASQDQEINRFWMRVVSDPAETLYGCGEQMSHFNLRGKHFPLWTSEPGVGRNKNTYLTWLCDVHHQAGGDYYNTNYPQPTYLSSRKYYLHVDSTAYADFDFRHDTFHELQLWEVPKQIRIQQADNFIDLLEKMTDYFGRQPELPSWVYNGLIIGVQGGTQRSMDLMEKVLEKGIDLAGVWCQDWQGIKMTSFGKRLNWNWQWDQELYPTLDQKIRQLKQQGIRFLGYINPYVVQHQSLYQEAFEKGYLAKALDGGEYLVDFGEFYCGVVDFTNPEAYEWYKQVIKIHLIQFGLDGWMADFGEYMPIDLKLHNQQSPLVEHNYWPVRWAKCNYEAVKETGKLGDILYFMRAGGAGTPRYCPLLWAGDQSVDFSLDDGLASVIVGALSAGMSGCGLTHSDIGGYTSLFDNCRTKELFLRWAEMGVFAPVMRTHEGNRPDQNFQFYDDDDTMVQLARLVSIYKHLTPYMKKLVKQNAQKGTPVQRPLFLHYENEQPAYTEQTQYLLGADILVAPVYLAGEQQRNVWLPQDEWVHLFTGQSYTGGTYLVEAPIGTPAVFYRQKSKDVYLFEQVREL